MAGSNMKFKDVCGHFLGKDGNVTQEEVKDNKDRPTTAWQSHQAFKAFVFQIKMYLLYGHSSKEVIPNEDLVDAFLIVIKQRACYQGGYYTWELP